MIKLNNVNKYFNRHKKNQIHVINNTTLTLDNEGLVAFLGPSGCGKTTLLNTIGGLDSVNSGDIYINDERITKRSKGKIDKIRSLKIGYIFQDYNLINNLSVYDNVALPLKMNGIKDKKEIKKRVDFVLNSINMYRYRNRLAGMLSGGERQRVGIARAIVKNPDIIIADEPTGNLDGKNTLEVMNIIKSISKNRLVILVTHEKELAEFYASRIITISDGVVTSDKKNDHSNDLDYKMDGKIYLKDIKNKVSLKDKGVEVNYYNDSEEKLKLNVVIKNGNIYIQSENKEKIEIIGEDTGIELVDEHYKKISKSIYEDYNFDFNGVVDKNIKEKYSSIFNIYTLLKAGFKKVLGFSIIKKLLLLGFFASSMFIVFAVSSIIASIQINDEDFVSYNKNYLIIKDNKISIEEFNNYNSYDKVSYILPGNSIVNFTVPIDDYYQTEGISTVMSGSLSSIDLIDKSDIIMGNMPSNPNEIVVDKKVLEKTLNKENTKQAGYLNIERFILKDVNVNGKKNYRVVGVVDLNDPSIYVSNSEFTTIINNSSSEYGMDEDKKVNDYKLYEGVVTLTGGSYPVNDYEVIINENLKDTYKIGKTLEEKVNGINLKVVGYYHSNTNLDLYLVSENTIKYKLITTMSDLTVYSSSKEEAEDYYQSLGINIIDSYSKSKEDYIDSIKSSVISKLIFSGVIIVISLIEIFLMMRSSFLSRIKEVGILRAIGLKKRDIYKMFSGEILAITILSSTPGLILMSYILKELSSIKLLSKMFVVNIPVIVISIILILGFNLIFGLIPVFTTLRKTPASILSRTDLE